MLSNRLQNAFDMYDACALAADIGTDHGQLPAALLRTGRCRRMILTDISESALSHARAEMERCGLTSNVSLRLGDGLLPLRESCGMISILGMGGRTISEILLTGRDRLRNASLLLSAHTDLPLVRGAVKEIGYHLERETPCFERGRFYLLLLARPGREDLTETEMILGKKLLSSDSEALLPYLCHRHQVLESKLRGLLQAGKPREDQIDFTRKLLSEEERMISRLADKRNVSER